MSDLDEFTRAYIEAALFSSMDDDEQPLDANYGIEDIAPEALTRILEDCRKFQEENAEDIANGPDKDLNCTDTEYAGHDFWLTRNHHGCGFWDGDWPEDAGKRLTDAAHKFDECDLVVGDDGLLYIEGGRS